jgi:sugar phosphate isomerase/epimerase
MRLGARIFGDVSEPAVWAAAVCAKGYRAAYCPVGPDADAATIAAYRAAARAADIVIAEVGAWSNPLSPDAATRAAALEKCKAGLALADAIGARCCVNIAGSRGEKWDGPHARDLSDETFDKIVASVREIVDAVQPQQSYYTLEPMPWMYPDSVESYQALIRAIDRKAFAVHFDPVNLINCPQRYFQNGALIRQFVKELGPQIRCCHVKDTLLHPKLTVHLDEVRPGAGTLDMAALLHALGPLDPDLPLMMEHMSLEEDYDLGAAYLRGVAAAEGLAL